MGISVTCCLRSSLSEHTIWISSSLSCKHFLILSISCSRFFISIRVMSRSPIWDWHLFSCSAIWSWRHDFSSCTYKQRQWLLPGHYQWIRLINETMRQLLFCCESFRDIPLKKFGGRGLSDVCLRGLKCTKRGSLKKEGGLPLKKEGVWGFSTRKKEGPGGIALILSLGIIGTDR